ncbi:MAG: hypothetical protein IPM54_31130 [Polyangiaceae bacterium]|nr:hypothetical protein [Polyangiaceae bacterium]
MTIAANPKEQGLHIQWRAYVLNDFMHETDWAAKLSHEESFPFRRAFIPHVCKYAWGAISAAIIRSLILNNIELTVPRVEGVLRHWEALDTLKYIDLYQRPISLTDLMVFYYHGHIAMWVDEPTGNIRTDLQTAIDQMRNASEDEIHTRLLARLRALVDIEKDLNHREWLKSPGVIEEAVEAERAERAKGKLAYDDLTTGQIGSHGGLLSRLERDHYPGNVH